MFRNNKRRDATQRPASLYSTNSTLLIIIIAKQDIVDDGNIY